MSQHTPGPWRVRPSERIDQETLVLADVGEHTGTVAVVHARSLAERGENGRLIAAAPDLLAACEQAEQLLLSMIQSTSTTMVTIRAAIAKAKGEL